MSRTETWEALQRVFESLDDMAGAALDRWAADLGLQEPWFPWFAGAALFGPDLFTTAQYMRIFPYGLATVNNERLTYGVQQGYLVSRGRDAYQATEKARQLARHALDQMYVAIAHLQPLPAGQMQSLVSYLARLADAALAAPKPSSIIIAHKRACVAAGDGAPLICLFAQYVNELSAYRDDAHIAAWQPLGVEGHAWETLTTLWRRGPATLDELHARLASRGLSRGTYADDLQALMGRGWVQEESGVYRISGPGQKAREDAEAMTERYFFAPWSCLSKAEHEELWTLAEELHAAMRQPATAAS